MHLLDIHRAALTSIIRATLQQMAHCVVAHVDGGIRQRFHQVLRIPRQTSS
jgi:hypothetical protein